MMGWAYAVTLGPGRGAAKREVLGEAPVLVGALPQSWQVGCGLQKSALITACMWVRRGWSPLTLRCAPHHPRRALQDTLKRLLGLFGETLQTAIALKSRIGERVGLCLEDRSPPTTQPGGQSPPIGEP